MPIDLGWPDFDMPDHCPACRARFDGLTNTTDVNRPDPGDPCVCLYCHTVNVMGDDMRLRLATDNEAMEFAASPQIQEMLWALRMVEQQHGPPHSRRHQ